MPSNPKGLRWSDPTLQLIKFDPRYLLRDLRVTARRIDGTFTADSQTLKKVNQRSVDWLSKRAVVELNNAIKAHGRPQTFNTGNLVRVIENPASHDVRYDGFRFMADERVRGNSNTPIPGKTAPYYRALEMGSSTWVGKRLPFAFIDGRGRVHGNSTAAFREHNRKQGPMGRDPVMGSDSPRRGDAIVGPRRYQQRGMTAPRRDVVIRNPVPAYRYSQKAYDAFLKAGLYKRWVNQEMKSDARKGRYILG